MCFILLIKICFLDKPSCSYEGYLSKGGKNLLVQYPKRYFRILGGALFWYKTKEDTSPLGEMLLNDSMLSTSFPSLRIVFHSFSFILFTIHSIFMLCSFKFHHPHIVMFWWSIVSHYFSCYIYTTSIARMFFLFFQTVTEIIVKLKNKDGIPFDVCNPHPHK